MIKAQCSTNLDDYDMSKWPDLFYEIPRIGDRVQDAIGRSLKVCGITHMQRYFKGVSYREDGPLVIIELNK